MAHSPSVLAKVTAQPELKPSTLLQPSFVEVEHSIANTSIACIKNGKVEIPENIQHGMDKRRIALAHTLQRQREMRLATRPSVEETKLRRAIAQKIMSGVDSLDLAKLRDFTATRNLNLQYIRGSVPLKLSPIPIAPPRDTTNDLMMWWGQTSVINMPGGIADYSFQPDGLHFAAEVEAHDGSAHDSSFTVLAQFYLDSNRIFPK